MPSYSFRHRETGEITTEFMSISELDSYKEAHPEVEQIIFAQPLKYIYNPGDIKPSQDFRERLREIKKVHKGNIDTF